MDAINTNAHLESNYTFCQSFEFQLVIATLKTTTNISDLKQQFIIFTLQCVVWLALSAVFD